MPALPRPAAPLLLVLCFAPAALAQGAVHLVDDDGPAAFTSIQAAVTAAASGDVVLVRAGNYAGFTVDGKALTVLADSGAAVRVVGDVQVLNLAGADAAVLAGLSLVASGPAISRFDLRTSVGPVWVEGCTGDGAFMFHVSHTAWLRCNFPSTTPTSGAGMLSFASGVTVLGSFVQGGKGADGFIDPRGILLPGLQGVHGYRATSGDVVFLSGSTLLAGDGGDGLEPVGGGPCSDGGDGGSGLAVFALDPVVRVQDVVFGGGAVGVGGTGCADGSPGSEMQLVPGAQPPESVPGSHRALSSNSPVREGANLVVTLDGEPGDTAFVMWSVGQAHSYQPKFKGAMLLANPILFPVPFGLPASGTLDLTVPVPELGPGLESVSLYLGSFFVDAGGAKFLGSSAAVVLLDAGV